MRFFISLCFLTLTALPAFSQKNKPAAAAAPYFPDRHRWEHKAPAEVGMDAGKIQELIAFARQNEAKAPRNMEVAQAQSFGKEPFGDGTGPFESRGEPSGLIGRRGSLVAEWGEPNRPDMTHSVTKSFLSSVVGLAVDKGLIASVTDTVARYVPPIELYTPGPAHRPAELFGTPELLRPFDTPHNRTLTWDVMLRQTSDWEGTLWGKPDWADRPAANASEWQTRARHAPGSVYEYNDVRVNALALAATSVWRRSLPQVLREYIMDPIGASSTWRWTGYRNSWIVLDGQPVQAVSGGGHWGGGMFINAYDIAPDGTASSGRLFANMHSAEDGVPDGMKVDMEGRVYCTGPEGVWVFDSQGNHLGIIRLTEIPANCAWGGPDNRTMFYANQRPS